MTAQTRAVNKSRFEQGDTPQGSDYADLIDSSVSIADTTAQSISSPLTVTGALGASTTVSAATGEFTTVSADSVVATTVSASSAAFETLTVGGETVVPATSASIAIGAMSITATASLTPSAAGAYSLISGTFTTQSVLDNKVSASPTLCELEYTGSATARFMASCYISLKASGNNKLSAIRIAVNGSSQSRSQIRRFIATGGDLGAAAAGCVLQLRPGERAGVMLTNLTDTTGFAVTDLTFTIAEQ